jgi:hypothetical protein
VNGDDLSKPSVNSAAGNLTSVSLDEYIVVNPCNISLSCTGNDLTIRLEK